MMVAMKEQRNARPAVTLVARARCKRVGEEELRRLYATQLDLAGGFILSMDPYEVGALLSMELYPRGCDGLPAVEARVIGRRIDPGNPTRSGFEFVFTYLPDDVFERLARALGQFQYLRTSFDRFESRPAPGEASRSKQVHERRVDPRVETDLFAEVDLRDVVLICRVLNLSMSGALLESDKGPFPDLIEVGTRLSLRVHVADGNESFTGQAVVTRMDSTTSPSRLGVRFCHDGETSARAIESIMLDVLTTWP